jgi:hypothetical protein
MNDGGSCTLKGQVDPGSDMKLYSLFQALGISLLNNELVLTYDDESDTTLVEGPFASLLASHAQRIGYEAV